jgi:hypothetical protein
MSVRDGLCKSLVADVAKYSHVVKMYDVRRRFPAILSAGIQYTYIILMGRYLNMYARIRAATA